MSNMRSINLTYTVEPRCSGLQASGKGCGYDLTFVSNYVGSASLICMLFFQVRMSGSLDGLPKQFVLAMRTLFDIMDDKRTGFVRFTGWYFAYKILFCYLILNTFKIMFALNVLNLH